MERRILGHTDLSVSVIGLGTWPMGGTVDTYGRVDDRESIAAIHQALDCGINLIDTAPIFALGHCEEIVGKATQGCRAQAIIATKCGLRFPRAAGELPTRSLRAAHVIRECEDSLRRLRTGHIDIYQCHWPDPETPIAETLGALAHLLEQGKVRAVGLCNFSCEEIAAARQVGPVHCVQTGLSLMQRRSLEDVIPYCAEHHLGVIPFGALAKGLFTGKFTAATRFADLRAGDPELIGGRFQRNLRTVDALRPIAAKLEKSLAQLAINWCVHRPGVTATIVGMKRPSHVLENVGALGWGIPAEQQQGIDETLRGAAGES